MSPPRNIDRARRGRAIAVRALFVLLLACACTGVWAKKADRQQPMDVHADHSDADLNDNGITVLTGNVIMTQGTLEIRSDKAVITRKDGEMSRAVLTGNPVHMKQLDENNEPMYATSQQLDYDLLKNIAVLTGNAVVNQPTRGQMHGERIVYDVDNGKVTSGGDGTRVVMHILPKPKPGQAPAPKAEAPPPDLPVDAPAATPASGKTP
ncbi:MAG: lipopolysaccharide transport periplasmic protein LptA [Proteobacteria bacterium]|nr:lipopolysaccharide transport periplasmic protein LptA [Pseudomonadota bacterium]